MKIILAEHLEPGTKIVIEPGNPLLNNPHIHVGDVILSQDLYHQYIQLLRAA